MNIITGYRGAPHITSAQDRAKNQGAFGEDSYILSVGQQLSAEIVSANEVRVRDGVLSHQGCVANIEQGAYDSLDISNGTQGMLRTDLIVARYTKDPETNVEDISLAVIEGEAAASAPVTPSYNEGDIQSGDTPVDMPLYRVNIDGVTISSVDLIADTIWSLQSIGDVALPTTATTITGAIAEHESDITALKAKITSKTLVENHMYQHSAANTWERVGASFTIPTNHRYIVQLSQGFTSGKPSGIGVVASTTAARPNFMIEAVEVQKYTVILGAGTWYIMSIRSTQSNAANRYDASAIDFDFS